MPGIPTARYIDHVGITVPSLEEATRFFVEVLNAQLLYTAGPYSDPDGSYLSTRLGVSDKACVRLAQLRLGANLNIELVEMIASDQCTVWPKLSDHGGYHIAISVDDFDAASEFLIGRPEIHVLEPHDNGLPGQGPEGGMRVRYFTAPFGLHLEIVERPMRQPYEDATDARVFSTKEQWPRAQSPRPITDLAESHFDQQNGNG